MKTLAEQLGISEDVLSGLKISKHNPEDILKALAAVALFQAKKIPLSQAAHMAGMLKREFENLLFDMGIPYEFFTVEEFEKDVTFLKSKGQL